MTGRPIRLEADRVHPVDAEPIPGGAVLVDAGGRIAAVGPGGSVPEPEGAESLRLPGAVLLPGLVNVHTHLELTGFEAGAPEDRFREWILTIRRLKAGRSREEFLAAARAGLRACWAGGVTTIADTGDSGAVIEVMAELGGSGIAYHEVFGPHPAQAEESMGELARRVEALAAFTGPRVRLGVSPHAPYTVSGPLYRRSAAWARSEGLPLAVHLAESPEETEFVTRGTGPFAEEWEARDIPLLDDPAHHPPGRPPAWPSSPVQWLDRHGVLGPDTLCIHAIQVSGEDVAVMAERGVAVAHCPLSNLRHHGTTAPLAALRRAGIPVGVGTDSVASVGRLDLLAERAEAMRRGGLSEEEGLRLATLDGARALGLDREIGSLTPGKWGDVTAVGPSGVVLTVLGGRVVHRA